MVLLEVTQSLIDKTNCYRKILRSSFLKRRGKVEQTLKEKVENFNLIRNKKNL